MSAFRERNGFVLIIVLLILAILVTVAVEFAHGVYVDASGLNNERIMESLSLEASSLVNSSGGYIRQGISQGIIDPTAPEMEIPIGDGVKVYFKVVDESGKFNVNSLVFQNGKLNSDAYDSFKRLLRALKLDEGIADRTAAWINPALGTSEEAKYAKGGPISSPEEMRLFLDQASFDRLEPYVTVFGDGLVNINTADVPVLMSLSDEVTEDMADRIITYRKLDQFKSPGELSKVAGFEGLALQLMPKITASSSAYRLVARAEQEGIIRIIDSVVDASGRIVYWREY